MVIQEILYMSHPSNTILDAIYVGHPVTSYGYLIQMCIGYTTRTDVLTVTSPRYIL